MISSGWLIFDVTVDEDDVGKSLIKKNFEKKINYRIEMFVSCFFFNMNKYILLLKL
jgi:hypothetical protein